MFILTFSVRRFWFGGDVSVQVWWWSPDEFAPDGCIRGQSYTNRFFRRFSLWLVMQHNEETSSCRTLMIVDVCLKNIVFTVSRWLQLESDKKKVGCHQSLLAVGVT